MNKEHGLIAFCDDIIEACGNEDDSKMVTFALSLTYIKDININKIDLRDLREEIVNSLWQRHKKSPGTTNITT